MRILTCLLLAALLIGCGSSTTQPAFAELHAVKGVVKRGGQPVQGGSVQFAADPPSSEFAINASVGNDGTFSLTTVRTTDKEGERKHGAPAGKYKVTYVPPSGDQVTGGYASPIILAAPVTIQAGENNLTIDLPKK